jgi:hypothetical protein
MKEAVREPADSLFTFSLPEMSSQPASESNSRECEGVKKTGMSAGHELRGK